MKAATRRDSHFVRAENGGDIKAVSRRDSHFVWAENGGDIKANQVNSGQSTLNDDP
jgi:hypothetical protein